MKKREESKTEHKLQNIAQPSALAIMNERFNLFSKKKKEREKRVRERERERERVREKRFCLCSAKMREGNTVLVLS